jgi:predicted  nucleic acid-binding Zn ribbon protein
MFTMPDCTHQEAGEYETYCEDGYNAMHVEGEITHKIPTMHEITFKKAVQKTAPLDAIFPTMRRTPDSMNQQQTHNRKSDAYQVAYQMDAMLETNLEEVKDADTESVNAPGAR